MLSSYDPKPGDSSNPRPCSYPTQRQSEEKESELKKDPVYGQKSSR